MAPRPFFFVQRFGLSASGMIASLRSLFWILAGAVLLLAPAIWWGRPFVFYDTPAYWGWGRDLFEALLRPWPHTGQPWIAGRVLHGWEIGAHGATAGDLRFTLTLLPARSAFYAVPFYLLTQAGGLWLVAGLQALAAAWTLRVVSRALVPGLSGWLYLGLVAALGVLTSLGFETAYAMPDLFGGLALAAAGVLIARPDRLSTGDRLGLCAVMLFAALAHTENGLNLAVAAAICLIAHRRAGPRALLARAAPIAAVLVAALITGIGGAALLGGAFGRPLHMAPFAAARVLADGGGEQYLKQTCPRSPLAACDLADTTPVYPEYYLGAYPLDRPPTAAPNDPSHLYDQVQFRTVSDAQADQRERFVAEQTQLVLGAFAVDGPHQVAAAFANGAAAFLNFGVSRDFDSLRGLMAEHTQRRDQIVAITPGADACAQGHGCACGDLDLGVLGSIQRAMVWASFTLIAFSLIRRSPTRPDDLVLFSLSMVALVLANAFLCGALSGSYDRYQSRVEWLIPLCALLEGLAWARRRRSVGLDPMPEATFPSPIAPTLASTAAARRP